MESRKDFILYQLQVEGFLFFQPEMPIDLVKRILELEFSYFPSDDGTDSKWAIPRISKELENDVKDWLRSEEDLTDFVDDLFFSAHTFKKNESLNLHNDVKDQGDFQILFWVCEHEKFKGREFLYGMKLEDKELIKSKKVTTGLVCLMNITNKSFVHGVSSLETDVKVITINGSHEDKSSFKI